MRKEEQQSERKVLFFYELDFRFHSNSFRRINYPGIAPRRFGIGQTPAAADHGCGLDAAEPLCGLAACQLGLAQAAGYLTDSAIIIPQEQMGFFQQMFYTFVTGIRDFFSLLRISVLFLVGYSVTKYILRWICSPFLYSLAYREQPEEQSSSFWSSLVGGVLGALMGAGRALILIALLFAYATLFPQTTLAGYIGASSIYQKGASEVVKPITGDFIANKIPVFTRAVEQEFNQIIQRKYEVIDAKVPDNITEAARQITADAKTDEEKARLLYRWVGTRVQYDWDKVNLYEQKRIWKEQTPEDTFQTRKGVCIDYSRLYAVMARAVNLDVKVVTGLGYDGRGSYGPHAWNEVKLNEQNKWVPLDSTWVASGGNWFNPPNFNQTHIREA